MKWATYLCTAMLICAPVISTGAAAHMLTPQPEKEIAMKKATPILFVEDVQQSVNFFVDALAFKETMAVPAGDQIVFAAVEKNGVEVMFQASGVKDETFSPEEMNARAGMGFIYFEVDGLNEIIDAVRDAEIIKAAHTTDYGSKEIYIREPGGNVLGFAEHQKQAE